MSSMKQMVRAFVALSVVTCVACGGGNPTAPSGGSGSSSGSSSGGGTGSGTTTGRGTMTAQIDGVAFTGVATVATNQSGIFATAASNSGNTITFGFGALASVGTTSIGSTSPTNANLVVVSGGTTQSWAAGTTGGSGTLTITTISALAATGTFTFTMRPVSGTGATKSVTNGSFSVFF